MQETFSQASENVNVRMQMHKCTKQWRNLCEEGLYPQSKGVARIFGWGALSGAKQQIVRLASRVRRREVPPIMGAAPLRGFGGQAHGGGTGAKPPENFQDLMLILDPESTCKWHCKKN